MWNDWQRVRFRPRGLLRIIERAPFKFSAPGLLGQILRSASSRCAATSVACELNLHLHSPVHISALFKKSFSLPEANDAKKGTRELRAAPKFFAFQQPYLLTPTSLSQPPYRGQALPICHISSCPHIYQQHRPFTQSGAYFASRVPRPQNVGS